MCRRHWWAVPDLVTWMNRSRVQPADETPYGALYGPAYHGEFVRRYDEVRPEPPGDLFDLLDSLSPTQPPALIVDLGSGTGISTVPWSTRAERVVGIEVNPEMIRAARSAPRVEYRLGSAQQTGLPDGCADIVTCAQAFHWMPYEPTIAEVVRLLRPGGCFAAYDYDWPPLINQEVEKAFLDVIARAGVDPSRPEKATQASRLGASGEFRYRREVSLHSRQVLDARQLSLLPYTFGPIARRLEDGVSPQELGLDQLQLALARAAPNPRVLWWSYRLHIATK